MARVGRVLVVLLSLAVALVAAPASAWTDAAVKSVELRVELDAAGGALVEHALTVVVHGGPLRGVDLAGVPAGVVPTADGSVLSAQPEGPLGVPMPLVVSLKPDGGLHAAVESPKGLMHGTYLFRVRYRQTLVGTPVVEPDGSLVRLRFTGATFHDGLDAVRCTFVVPRAPHEPRVAGEPGTEDEDVHAPFLVESHRLPDRDELSLTRAHVAKGEVVVWPIRLDPRALAEVHDARIRPEVPPPPAPPTETPEARVREWGALAVLALAFSALVARKSRAVGLAARAAGACARPLLPIGAALRALLAGPLWAAGVALQRGELDPLFGSALVAAAALLTTWRAPVAKPAPRGAGRWLPLSDAEAFTPAPRARGAWLDVATVAGRLGATVAALAVTVAIVVAARASSFDAWLVAIDALPLVALFATGSRGELPPARGSAAARELGELAKRLRALPGLRVVAVGRLPHGSREVDELRLLVAPRVPRRGLVGLEIGFAWAPSLGGYAASPEILVRVLDASPAQDAFTRALGGPRWVRGRKPDERVASVLPDLPLALAVARRAAELADVAREPEPPADAPRSSRQSPMTAARSRGRSERITNAGTAASPVHAT